MPYACSLLEFLEERYHASPGFSEKAQPGQKPRRPQGRRHRPRAERRALQARGDPKNEHKLPDHPEFMPAQHLRQHQGQNARPLRRAEPHRLLPHHPRLEDAPRASRRWTIIGIVTLPEFRWDEAMLHARPPQRERLLKSRRGPNNPVGVLWTGLNKPASASTARTTPRPLAAHRATAASGWQTGTPRASPI